MTAQAGDTFFSTSAAKADVRNTLRRIRKQLSGAQRRHAAQATARCLLRLRRVRRARSIAIYLAMKNELDTGPLIDWLLRAGKRVFVPRIGHDGQMFFTPLKQYRRVRRDALGMRASLSTRPRWTLRRFDIVIIPLVGFDASGNRIGMGAGYYDRAFDFQRIGTRPWRIGYGYSQQQVERLPVEPWDVKLDAVALSSGLRVLKGNT